MHRYGPVFACLLAAAGWAHAASPNPDDLVATPEIQVKARALVRQLGSDDFPTREGAQQQLADLGRHARPALLSGVNTSPDPEVRLRCAQLLPAATALDVRARLDTFLADTKGEYRHDLPAWNAFRAAVRSEWSVCGRVVWTDRALDLAAREVFAELAAAPANRRVLLAIDGSRVELATLALDRRHELSPPRFARRGGDDPPRRDPTLADVTALLFAESRIGSQYAPRQPPPSYLLSSSGFMTAARGTDEKAKVYRAVAAVWLDSRNDPRDMSQALTVAGNLGLTDQECGLAARLLTMPGVAAMYRSRAASVLVSSGGRKHVPLLAKALSDTVVVATVAENGLGLPAYEVQVRDLALAVSVVLAGQKAEDYGFRDRYADSPPYDGRSFTYTRYYFADDAARKKALAKWAEWRAAHPDG